MFLLRVLGVKTQVCRARAHSDPIELDRRSSFLFGRIFFDEPVSTSSENACLASDLRGGMGAASGLHNLSLA